MPEEMPLLGKATMEDLWEQTCSSLEKQAEYDWRDLLKMFRQRVAEAQRDLAIAQGWRKVPSVEQLENWVVYHAPQDVFSPIIHFQEVREHFCQALRDVLLRGEQ